MNIEFKCVYNSLIRSCDGISMLFLFFFKILVEQL